MVTLNRTSIEWVKNPDGSQGYSWNPITGCLNGCEYCYARKLANTRLKERYLANKNLSPDYREIVKSFNGWRGRKEPFQDPFYPRLWTQRLHNPTDIMFKSKGIFTCDMSDLFGIGIPELWTKEILNIIDLCHQHRFYLLTKQPQNLIKFSPFPDNAWVGVSATNQEMLIDALSELRNVKAKVKYISFEPLQESMNGGECDDIARLDVLAFAGIKWVIIGSQTKPYKPPKIEWVREIVEACDKAGIPVFLKENLKPLLKNESLMGMREEKLFWNEPEWGTLRQEMPT